MMCAMPLLPLAGWKERSWKLLTFLLLVAPEQQLIPYLIVSIEPLIHTPSKGRPLHINRDYAKT
jgi:hypothetical protein